MAVPQRIVSLLPGSTEILCALGLEARLVGVSPSCDYPGILAQVPRLTSATPVGSAPPGPAAAEQAIIQASLSTEMLDLPLLRQLQPDLIVTQAPEATDGALPSSVLEATRRYLGTPVEVLVLHPTLLQDIWDMIYLLGQVTSHTAQAATLLDELFARVNPLVAESIRLPPPRVAVLSQCAPLQVAGYWLPDMIQIAGGTAGLSQAGQPAQQISWQQLLSYAPEVLLVMPHDTSLTQLRDLLPALQAQPGWQDIPAVQHGQAYAVDGRVSCYRPGPRIVDGLELLAGLMHPEVFGDFVETQPRAYVPIMAS
ncbi:MAG: ABC transporter substrate-binding protein [Candidatus Tectimicrobiota bacterium]